MPVSSSIISNRRRDSLRRIYATRIHAINVPVRMWVREESKQSNPQLKPQMQAVRVEFPLFPCSYYNTLSGKIGRIFRNRNDVIQSAMGIIDNVSAMIEYVPDMHVILAVTAIADSGTPTSLIDLDENFLTRGVRVGAKVSNVLDGSTGIITAVTATQLTFVALSGGTLNDFAPGDAYTVHNDNNLRLDDQVFVYESWKTVLAVLPDSTNVQVTALLGD